MPRTKPKKLAVFDIDGTVFRSSLLIELVEALISERYFPHSARKNYEKELQRWQNRQADYEEYIQKIVQTYIKYIKGIHIDEVISVAQRVLYFKKNRTYTYTTNLIQKLQKTHYLIAISGSPFHIVEPFARDIGFQKIYAAWYQTNTNGILTGIIEYEDLIFNKEKILHRAVEKENLSLKHSLGVGDSDTDIGFLKMVEKPIAFNPNKKLLRAAKRNKWEIVVERKNVIHKL